MEKRRDKKTLVGTSVRYFETRSQFNYLLGYWDKPSVSNRTVDEVIIPKNLRQWNTTGR